MTGSAYDPPPEPITHVQEGMQVVDRTGENVGTVELVKLGDPQAVTPRGQAAGGGGIVDELKIAFGAGEPQVPDELAARLMRLGYVKIDGKGILDRDLYVAADQLETVSGGVVHLAVAREELIPEG